MGLQHAEIYFGPSELHGRGVFAARDIEPGEIIEICPVLVFSKEELVYVRQTFLDDYYFDWGTEGDYFALCLGYGSLYNHEYEPNAEYGMDFDALTIDFYAIKAIKAGEEITVNYNGEAGNREKVWFENN
jgi:SET domain-containing protein